MKKAISLLSKVPKALRFPVLAVLALIGFVLFFIGWDEAITWLCFLGAGIDVFVFQVFRYIIKSKAQL